GTFFLFPDLRILLEHSYFFTVVEICKSLLRDEYVAMMPGVSFGLSGFDRISGAIEMPEVDEDMTRVA
ncbi:pyridoxal phosphate-dependent aminotransferase, partial [Francisella tularensis subsp. holarctica]|nr:pyridoxal phosphate-dependent aminotransferase [Francisella tularensis subsp. holarctica]